MIDLDVEVLSTRPPVSTLGVDWGTYFFLDTVLDYHSTTGFDGSTEVALESFLFGHG